MLLSPISATVFGIKYWTGEKKPFLAYITTFIPAVALGFYVFSTLGGWNLVHATLNVQQGIESENLSEQDNALAFMRSNLDFIEKTITDEEDQKKIDVMRDFLEKFESGMTEEDLAGLNREMLELVSTEDLTEEQRRQLDELRQNLLPEQSDGSDIQAETSQNISGTNTPTEDKAKKARASKKKYPMKFVKIDVSDAKKFVGYTFKVKSANGIDRTYRLIAFLPNSLRFEQREQGGMLTFEIEKRHIRELKVFTRQALR